MFAPASEIYLIGTFADIKVICLAINDAQMIVFEFQVGVLSPGDTHLEKFVA